MQSSDSYAPDLLSAGFSMRQLSHLLRLDSSDYKLSSGSSGLPLKPPVSSARFHEILRELGELHDKKQKDYGAAGDPFANIRASSNWGVAPWVGALIRAGDKFKRLQQYAASGSLANEGAEDSFRDLAVYAIIALVLWEEEAAKKPVHEVIDQLPAGDISFEDQQCRLCGQYYEGVHTCLSSQ